VDSEYLLRQFRTNGHTVYHDAAEIEADAVILNTCGFILDAKQESIENILYYTDLKKAGRVGKVFVMGCLSERYREELEREIPEVDGFFGVWDHKEITEALDSRYYPELSNDRYITTPSHYAFLKISEGCNRRCSFCAIPGIRGNQRSKSADDLVEEALNLAGRGVKELILIAQDLTGYGTDIYGENRLAFLLASLLEVEGIEWIRLHYAYPTGFPEEVIRLMANESRICNYIDIPIQHISDRILSSMRRGHDRRHLETLLNRFRKENPGIAVRSTVMVGYPGETAQEFQELLEFVRAFRFDRLGVFPYSHEEDTPAGRELKDDVPMSVKQQRAEQLMDVQQAISLELNEHKIGKTFTVLIDREEDDFFIGRTEHDSPDVDNEVLVSKAPGIGVGEFCSVRITSAAEFDLFGEPTRESTPAGC
jgi:ribosomal protein S12 methylthiotransferase